MNPRWFDLSVGAFIVFRGLDLQYACNSQRIHWDFFRYPVPREMEAVFEQTLQPGTVEQFGSLPALATFVGRFVHAWIAACCMDRVASIQGPLRNSLDLLQSNWRA